MIKIFANLCVVIFIIIHLSSSEIYDPGQKHINYDVNYKLCCIIFCEQYFRRVLITICYVLQNDTC